jgi:long-chain acyl-CoA synthetase
MTETKLPLEKFYHFEATTPDQIYLRQPHQKGWIEYSWKEVGLKARKFAQALKNSGLNSGDCVALLSKNCADWIIADLGIWMAGCISIPIYPTLKADTIRYILNHSEAKVLIAGKLDDWEEQSAGVPVGIRIICFDLWPNEDATSWSSFTSSAQVNSQNHLPQAKDISTIIYTSGTTGLPKGVVHTFESLSAHINLAVEIVKISSSDRFFSYLPLSHVAERLLIELGSLYSGGQVAFAESLESFKKNIIEVKPTIFLAVPRIWQKFQQGVLAKIPQKKLRLWLKIPILNIIIRKKIKKEMGLDQLRYALTGAAPISEDILRWFAEIGIPIHEVYGMTENFGIASFNQPGRIKWGTVGAIWENTEIRISSEGEIKTRSKANMLGYFKELEKTREVLDADGWLSSGDKGILTEEGYLKITGRVKDLFKTSKGKYISPAQLESFFSTSQIVEQVCVVGSGLEQPIALINLSELAKKKERDHVFKELIELMKILNSSVENFEQLHRVIIIDEIWSIDNGFLTPTLKLKRNEIEKRYGAYFYEWMASKDKIIFWGKSN